VGWDTADFDARPKDGDNRITWDSAAQFISGSNLDTNNTVLFRI
jgi:hypothetical protein